VRLKPFVYQEMSVKLCPFTWPGHDLPRCFYTCRMNSHRPLFSLDSSADGISYAFEFHIVDFAPKSEIEQCLETTASIPAVDQFPRSMS
jgi:hypothetical protein